MSLVAARACLFPPHVAIWVVGEEEVVSALIVLGLKKFSEAER